MNELVREEWRRGIQAVVCAAMQSGQAVAQCGPLDPSPLVSARRDLSAVMPELSDASDLGLSVLLGDPKVPVRILIGCLEDSGVYPSGALVEVVERAVQAERARCARIADQVASDQNRGGEWHSAAQVIAAAIREEISLP